MIIIILRDNGYKSTYYYIMVNNLKINYLILKIPQINSGTLLTGHLFSQINIYSQSHAAKYILYKFTTEN